MSKSRAFQLGAAALVAAGVLSACSSGNGGVGSIPPPAPGSSDAPSSSSVSSGGASGAPSVPSPLPTTQISSNPCTALSADQVSQIGLAGAGTMRQGAVGPSCKWRSATSTLNSISLTPATTVNNGLNAIYANKAKNQYFQPTTVNGYPAVYADTLDSRTQGDCSLWVGVTDQLSVAIMTSIGDGPNKSNPCPIAEKVATAMIQHLQGS